MKGKTAASVEPKGKKSRSGCLIYFLLGFGALWFFLSQEAKRDDEAEQKYLKEHPLTEKQLAANKHFNHCHQYRSSSRIYGLSEQQRYYAILAESCFSDDHDDPRYLDATYPWNEYAPHPWK